MLSFDELIALDWGPEIVVDGYLVLRSWLFSFFSMT